MVLLLKEAKVNFLSIDEKRLLVTFRNLVSNSGPVICQYCDNQIQGVL